MVIEMVGVNIDIIVFCFIFSLYQHISKMIHDTNDKYIHVHEH